MKPNFIVFEGAEGVGKSTAIKSLYVKMIEHGMDVIKVKENDIFETSNYPYNTIDLGFLLFRTLESEIRDAGPNVEILIWAAARLNLWEKVIKPHLEKENGYVLGDRFVDSTRIYQALDDCETIVEKINNLHMLFLPDAVPDVVFILDLPIEQRIERILKRNETKDLKYINRSMINNEKIRKGFLHLANKGHPYYIIDASQSVEQITQDCWDILTKI